MNFGFEFILLKIYTKINFFLKKNIDQNLFKDKYKKCFYKIAIFINLFLYFYFFKKKFMFTKKIGAEFFLLSIGLLTLVIQHLIFPISLNVQLNVLLIFVFIVGVPHGALDFLVDEQNEEVSKKEFSLKKFLAVYITRLFAFALFWFIPWLAFSLFIIFSIFHFGETDMSAIMKPTKHSSLLYFAYGGFILSLLLLTHLSEIQTAIPLISDFLKQQNLYELLKNISPFIVVFFGGLWLIVIVWQMKKGNIIQLTFLNVLQFVCLISVIVFLPLLLAFTFYFALWHSILSVRNIFAYFKNFNNSKKFTIICGKSILFSLLALGSIIGLYFGLNYFMPNMNLLFALLIVLSVLTLPHLTVMHGMYKNYSRNI